MKSRVRNAWGRALCVGLPLLLACVIGAMGLAGAHRDLGSAVLAALALGALCGIAAVQLFVAWLDVDKQKL